MQAHTRVGGHGGRTDQGAELTGRLSALQVHLEEAIVGVEDAQGPGDIAAGGAADGRNATRVAGDGDRGREAGERLLPVEHRKAVGEAGAHPPRGSQAEHEQ